MADTVEADSYDADADRRLVEAVELKGWVPAPLLRECVGESERTRTPVSEVLRSRGHLSEAQLRELQSGPAPADPKPPPEVEEAIAAGAQRVSRYVLVRHLKTGGMGLVFQGWDRPLGRWVAIKLMKSIGSAESREQFLREARLAAHLEHANIADVYEIGEHDGAPFIAMQFIDGSNLWEARRTLTRDVIVRLMRDVCAAVQYAHDKGIVHRDLKPMNLMIDRQQRVYVLDFGIAKQIEVDGVVAASGTNVLMGTPEYMPPEQARGNLKEVDRTSDVYSLGACLYELLTGRPPFQSENRGEVIAQVIHDEPVPVRRLVRDVPADLETIAMKCLEKDKARRYGSAREVAEDLERFAAGDAIAAHPPSAWYRFAKRVRKRPVVYVLGLALLLAVSGGATFGAYTLVQRNVALSAQVLAESDARRKEEQRARAEEARRKTEEEARVRVEEEQGRTKEALTKESQSRRDAELAQKLEAAARTEAESAQKKEEAARRTAEDAQKKEEAARKEAETQKAAALRQLAYGYHLRARALGESGEHGRAAALYAEANRHHETGFYAAKAGYHLSRAGRLVAAFPLQGEELAQVPDAGDAVRFVRTRSFTRLLRLDDGTLGPPIETDESVRRIDLSPDGSRLAAMTDQSLRLIEADGRTLEVPAPSRPYEIEFDPTGRKLLVLYDDGAVEIRETTALAVIATTSIAHVKSTASYWAFKADGRVLAAHTATGDVHVLDLTAAEARLTTIAFGSPAAAIAFTGTGHLLAAALASEIHVRRVADGTGVGHAIRCTVRPYTSIVFAGDETLWADTTEGVRRFDIATGQPRGDPIPNATLHADGSLISERIDEQTLACRDPMTGERLLEAVRAGPRVYPDRGRNAIIVPTDGSCRIYTVGSRDPPREVDLGAEVANVRVTRDGRVAAVSQRVHAVESVDTWSGRATPVMAGLRLDSYGYSSVLSPDGTLVADHGFQDTHVRLVSERGSETIEASAKIIGVGFDPRSQHLVVWDGKRLTHWSRATGRLSALPQADEKSGPDSMFRGRKFAFTRDGRFFALGGKDAAVRIWNLETDALAKTITLLSRKEPDGIVFHPSGRWIAAVESQTVNLYDVTSGALKTSCPAQSRVNDVSFRADGTLAATADDAGRVILWDVNSGQRNGSPMEHFGEIAQVDFDTSGRFLLAHSRASKTVYLWDAQTQARLNAYLVDDYQSGHVVANRSRLVLIARKQVQIWDLRAPAGEFAPVGIPGSSGECWTLDISPDGAWLATTHREGRVHVLNLEDPRAKPRLVARATRHDAKLAFSPDSSRLAVSATFTMLFDLQTGEAVGDALKHAKFAEAVTFSADGRSLYVLDGDTVTVWDPDASRRMRTIDFPASRLSPQGRFAIKGLHDAEIIDLATGASTGKIPSLQPLFFSDGAWTTDCALYAAVADEFTDVGIWRLPTGEATGPLLRHRANVNGLAFHPRTHVLAVCTIDGFIYLWDVAAREEIARYAWSGKEPTTIAFTPAGALYAGAADGSVCRLALPYLAGRRSSEALTRHVGSEIALTLAANGDVEALDVNAWKRLRR